MTTNGNGQSSNGHGLASAALQYAPQYQSRSVVRMAVHTHDTHRLVSGRAAADGKPAIIGLFGYAERLRIIWDAAKLSDPYASWWLLRVEDAFAAAVFKIELERASIHNDLKAASGFDIELPAAEPLHRIELNFACPYAYWGARVLKSYDELVLDATTAERLGLRRGSRQRRNRFRCERAIRGLFAAALGYHALGVTANDIRQDNALAAEARALMGDVPRVVLNGERTPSLLLPQAAANAAGR